jgi:3'(2'), 5'-bisphosphate nucleotidase
VADYSAQAVVNPILSHVFPDGPIVGEEALVDLRAATGKSAVLHARVVKLADNVLVRLPLHTTTSGGGGEEEEERAEWGADALLEAIGRGSYASGCSERTYEPLGGGQTSSPAHFFFLTSHFL